MISVLIADDQQLVRAGVRMLCESTADITVAGEAVNGAEALRLTERLQPDVVLMDLHMPGMDGIMATRQILRVRPATRVVVLTTFDDDDRLYPALSAGACGFLAKDVSPESVLDAIRRAVQGESPYSSSVLRRVVSRAATAWDTEDDRRREAPHFTDREREVLRLVAEGLSNTEIGERMHIGITTVKTHVSNLMTKTGSPNRVRLAVLAIQQGLTAR
ncbi:DNA-binding NarL/FixJ family response regulator [Kitasatospora gansuensis]|uniref:DNA-binding NarL/FixJ family response regulator n=1 Tax=Kitasatospora gansuensis TaxID=258050 RepID=A0A7W7S9E4_9ACTN|nr:response regulator transcription factor [Kitasatospora gansuensis]MBB4945698.1 DNA-binding NarL/FixJ family response regulator [Kitasatospora gansuensis]